MHRHLRFSPIITSGMVEFENYLAQMIVSKNHVATSKVKFTVRTYSLCIGLNETYSCPAHNLLLGLPQGWYDIGIWFSIRSYGPIKALSYSRHQAGASVSCGHISFLVIR